MKTTSIIVIGLVALVTSLSLYTVKQQEYAIKFRLGEIIDNDIPPGLHFKMPLVNNVRKFDNRILEMDMPTEVLNTIEQEFVEVDYYVNWKITQVADYYISTRGDEFEAQNRLAQIISDRLREEFAQRTLGEVISVGRGELMQTLTNSVNDRAGELGIEIVDIRIKRIELTDSVLDSVFTRMQTDRNETANEQRSLGREAAERIRSDADRQARILQAEAGRDASKLRGEGDAEATRIYAEAYNRDVEFYRFQRSLEAYRNSFGNGQDTLVLDPESEFFDYFRDQNAGASQ